MTLRLRTKTWRKAWVSWSARAGSSTDKAARCASLDGPPSIELAVRAIVSIIAEGPTAQPMRQPG